MKPLPQVGDVIDGHPVIDLSWTYDPDGIEPPRPYDVVTAWLQKDDDGYLSVDFSAVTGERLGMPRKGLSDG